jgi:hypothetical protein
MEGMRTEADSGCVVAFEVEEFDVPLDFENLSEVELAYMFEEKLERGKELEHVEKWKPLPDAFFMVYEQEKVAAPRAAMSKALRLRYTDADEEMHCRMYREASPSVALGEVEIFLRACKDFFGSSWQTLRDVRMVATLLELPAACELTTLNFMANTGTLPTQGTWFAYWQVGTKPRTSGAGVHIRVRLAPQFFGVWQ